MCGTSLCATKTDYSKKVVLINLVNAAIVYYYVDISCKHETE